MADRVKKKKISAARKGKQIPRSARNDKNARNLKRATSARDDKHRGELLYLYGISGEGPGLKLEGVDGRSSVEAIRCAGLTCWVSRVDAHEFGEELQSRMENLDWLAGASVRHQRVVGAIHEKVTVLPARFATLFKTEESLAADVKRRIERLRQDLERVEGADEYGVKIFASPKAIEPAPDSSSGRDYLKRKSQMLRQPGTPAVSPEIEEFVNELRSIATESAAGGSVSGGQKNLVWQGSLLVPRSERKRLESALARFRRIQGDGFRIECTGPWPPYSFIAVKAEAR